MVKVIFDEWDCYIEFGEYPNGRTAIELINKEDGDSVLVASVNLPDEILNSGEIAIKNYSENTGVMELLINTGVISQPIRYVNTGMVRIPICKLI
jgi:hypothetical protein